MDGGQRKPGRVGEWLRSAFTENIGLKALSWVIALALFGVVRGAGNVQRSLDVSLIARLPSTASRRVLLTDLPDSVRLTVRGSPGQVSSLRPDDLGPIQLDLSDGHRSSVIFDPASLSIPAGVQVVQLQPSALQLQWDDFVERSVAVRVEASGTPAPGTHVLGGIEVTPREVRVSGPALYVGAFNTISTEVLDVTGLPAGRHERRLPLAPVRAGLHVDLSGGVRVAFTIDREIAERRFERLTVTPVGVGAVELRPAVVTVTLRGAPSAVESISPDALVPTIEVPTALAPRTNVRAHVTLSQVPRDTDVVSIEPAEVVVVPSR